MKYYRYSLSSVGPGCPLTGRDTATTMTTAAALCVGRRFQSFMGDQRSLARGGKSSFRHPLAPKDPSQRNVTVPTSASRKAANAVSGGTSSASSSSALSAEDLKKRAQRALLLNLQQEVLWEGTVVDNVHHALVQHFIKLSSNEKYRQARQMLVIGGRSMIEELCQAGFRPRHLMVDSAKPIPEWAKRQQGTDVVLVNRQVAAVVAPGTDGYVGDFQVPPPPMKELLIANHQRLNRVLVLDNVHDPGVLGTLLRTASGYQYDAIITTNHCADLYDHRVLRAARGAHFQASVPIYTLREEDGDDVYGLLNHVVERNNLQPLCYTAQEDAPSAAAESSTVMTAEGVPTDRSFRSSVVGAAPIPVPTLPRCSASAPSLGLAEFPQARQETLSDFCLRQFARASSVEEDAAGGYMLFAGPNPKRNMLHRVTSKMARPATRLLLDSLPTPTDTPSDLVIAMSIMLYALRPRSHWDYLPTESKPAPSSLSLQTSHVSVDIGVNRLRMKVDDINLDEDEQREKAHLANEYMRWRRLSQRRGTDYDHWMEAEHRRIQGLLKREKQQRITPWQTRVTEARIKPMPDWVPNIIDEYRQSLGRDALWHERDISSVYQRPPR